MECIADWWYAVIGHLDSCNQNCCRCHYSGKKISDSVFCQEKPMHVIILNAFNIFKLNIGYLFQNNYQ